ncbi:solute carrier family 15 member 5 [Coturnix japonica]|uniref:Solute carrier family 15 member 5 n=1 Tax=Coturnix japonica TaxID=93934 RepID=A0A8C2Y625_COTJA|nr:solute carrier family 15 member 5 [Coturnix japonica]XP_015723307.1 solute carrier family 15 member 5 [Coturnix japonica]XP_015723314.1 solute carrier family 15 member 5 [Coturnix japonica]XP_015723317.1 solute carrier family 15 member 5 [Coturnix japonica]
MPGAGSGDIQEKQLMTDTEKEKNLLPGRRNHAGNLTLPEKKVQEAICVLLVELCERFTFFGIVCNMILFCTVRLGYRNYQAAIVNMCFVGTSMLTPVLAGWLAECLVGRIKLVCICMFLHFLGTALLPIVAFPFEDIYIDKRHILLHTLTKKEQKIVFYFALLTASLGIGGIRAIVCPLSAYNLENCGPKELLSFFNWFYWLINLNSAVVFVSISYIQQSVARNLGFLLPFVSVLMAMITIHMVRGEMIYKPKTDSSLLTTFGVIGSALKTCCVRYRYFSGDVSSWLDYAKEYHGGRYSETQVESTKSLARLFPLFAFQILYRTCIMQIPSGYYLQTMNSNLNFGGFVLPIAAMNVISIVPLLILVPILECINSYLFSSKGSRHSPTIYIVAGQLSAALSVMAAGFSEIHRKHFPQVEQTLSEEVLLVSSMPCFHLAPQYILLGVAEALVTPSCALLSFWFVPERIRGISMHFLTLFNGAGCFMGAFFVQTTHAGTQGNWFPHLLHEGKLERFFFFLASLMMVNTLGFWTIAHRYSNLTEECTSEFRGSLSEEKEVFLKHDKVIKHYGSVLDRSPILSPMETT